MPRSGVRQGQIAVLGCRLEAGEGTGAEARAGVIGGVAALGEVPRRHWGRLLRRRAVVPPRWDEERKLGRSRSEYLLADRGAKKLTDGWRDGVAELAPSRARPPEDLPVGGKAL